MRRYLRFYEESGRGGGGDWRGKEDKGVRERGANLLSPRILAPCRKINTRIRAPTFLILHCSSIFVTSEKGCTSLRGRRWKEGKGESCLSSRCALPSVLRAHNFPFSPLSSQQRPRPRKRLLQRRGYPSRINHCCSGYFCGVKFNKKFLTSTKEKWGVSWIAIGLFETPFG